MIRTITIENFKSIDRLELDLGRVNVFIGENGCGKSNILEAISFGAAAAADKLDHEFLVSRGIRVTDPRLMRSAFKAESLDKPIKLSFMNKNTSFEARLVQTGTSYAPWKNEILDDAEGAALIKPFLDPQTNEPDIDRILRLLEKPRSLTSPALGELVERLLRRVLGHVGVTLLDRTLPNYIAFTPVLEALRSLDLDSSIEPIGIHGEGLFKLLQVLEQEGHLAEVKAELEMIDWFADLEVFSGPNPALRELRIRDQYLDSAVAHFDQRSANEGFLFLLLYTCLLVSKYTPAFFAVDNIETGLNPKLCAGLIGMFARLTKSHDKQVLLTTHNPGTLDGLDLNDDEQRLFVVYRNVEGATRARRIERTELPSGDQPVRLSEAFLRGYIGGLPTNF